MGWKIIEWPIPPFEYEGKTHKWVISYQETIHLPTVFQVNDDRNYFVGQLIYYEYNDLWQFFYMNKENIQKLADILSNFVIKGYQ